MRKRRTRSHIIADLSANHFERHVLHCGFSVERMVHDYGVDLLLYTYTDDGQVENETVKVQLKATDHLPLLGDGMTVSFPVERADLEFWLDEWLPVILVVYDAQKDEAYWVYLQDYFRQIAGFNLRMVAETVNVHLSTQSVVDIDAIRQFARFKQGLLHRFAGASYGAI